MLPFILFSLFCLWSSAFSLVFGGTSSLTACTVAFLLNVVFIALLSQITGQRLEWQKRLLHHAALIHFSMTLTEKVIFCLSGTLGQFGIWSIFCYECTKIEPIRPGFNVVRSDEVTVMCNLVVLLSGLISALATEPKGFCWEGKHIFVKMYYQWWMK